MNIINKNDKQSIDQFAQGVQLRADTITHFTKQFYNEEYSLAVFLINPKGSAFTYFSPTKEGTPGADMHGILSGIDEIVANMLPENVHKQSFEMISNYFKKRANQCN